MTKHVEKTMPDTGGRYRRQPDGSLKRERPGAAAAKTKTAPIQAPAVEKKGEK